MRKNITIADWKQYLRDNDFKGDPWGAVMGLWFGVSAYLARFDTVPASWQYSAGAGDQWAALKIEQPDVVYLLRRTPMKTVRKLGASLERLADHIKVKGLDY